MTITERPRHIVAGRHTQDDGLFGPGTVTWSLHSDPGMLLVGILAATTQMLHPRVMRMIDQASAFRTNPEARGRQTGLYVQTITFADEATARNAGATLRRIHQAVKAVDPESGETYDAEVPELLEWVQNTLTWAALRVFDQYRPQLLAGDARDRYVAEQKIAGELLGIDPDVLPATARELDDYLERMLPQLVAIPESAWFVDMMTSRTVTPPKNGVKKGRVELRFEKAIRDAALELMRPEHRELFDIRLARGRSLWSRFLTRRVLGALRSKTPAKTIASLREQVDVQAFGGRRA